MRHSILRHGLCIVSEGRILQDRTVRRLEASKDEIRAEHAGLPDLAACLEHAPLLVPERVVGDPGRGEVRRATVHAESLAPALARWSDVPQAASDEKPAGERGEPALAPWFVKGGCDEAVRGEPGQRPPLLGEVKVHAAVGDDVEREAASRPKAERPHPSGRRRR